MRIVRIKTETRKPKIQICKEIITSYILHTKDKDPSIALNTSSLQPLRLTRKEIKRLRTWRNLRKEKERRELILQGLLKPPEPSIRLSSFIRTIGNGLTECYTQTEQEIETQIAKKHKNHESRNLMIRLTPLEARKKRIRKLFDQHKAETYAAVYRIAQPATNENRYKININALENRMVGLCVITDNSTLLIV